MKDKNGLTPLEKNIAHRFRTDVLLGGNGILRRNKHCNFSRTGLTLVEVLITCFMVALIGVAVYSSLNNGIKAWARVQQKLPEEDVAIFFDKFFNEVSNSFQYPRMGFIGNQAYFTFPTIITERGQYADVPGRGIGRCSYNFNSGQNCLERAQEAYSDIFEDRAPYFSCILSDVEAFVFSYYFYDKEKEEFSWSGEWPPAFGAPQDANLPLAVRAEIAVSYGKKTYGYTKVVSLSLAGR